MNTKTPKNFTLYSDNQYQGYPIYTAKGPLIKQYLERTFDTISHALNEYPRTLALRVDLHFPWNGMQKHDNQVINRFFKSLREQIKHNRAQATKQNPYAHQSKVRYIWCKEQDTSASSHYHVLILLNHDAFGALGGVTASEGNMAARIKKAWLRALGYHSREDMMTYGSLVHFCDNSVYKINAQYDSGLLADLLYRASYFCKAETKNFAHHQHFFGRSNG
ncbi:inovirus Gp2 family protein [Vibrio algivorus]|nr:inovirus Gp2 family protein [Vibrio algivorus]